MVGGWGGVPEPSPLSTSYPHGCEWSEVSEVSEWSEWSKWSDLFLVKLRKYGDRSRVLSRPRYRPPTPVLASEKVKKKSEKVKSESEKVKVKSEKWSESESIFGPLIFFNFRYIKVGVWGNNSIGIKKFPTIFLWVLNFGEVGEILENFQKHPLGESFWKIFY